LGPAPRRQIDAPKTLADEAYQRIHDDIFAANSLQTTSFNLTRCARRYNIGLSPVREALSRALRWRSRGRRRAARILRRAGDAWGVARHADLRINFSVLRWERSIRTGGDDWENSVVTAYYQLNKLENRLIASLTRSTMNGTAQPRVPPGSRVRLRLALAAAFLRHPLLISSSAIGAASSFTPYRSDDRRRAQADHGMALARDTAACKVLSSIRTCRARDRRHDGKAEGTRSCRRSKKRKKGAARPRTSQQPSAVTPASPDRGQTSQSRRELHDRRFLRLRLHCRALRHSNIKKCIVINIAS